MTFNLFMHHIVFVLYLFVLTCSLPLVFVFLFALCLGRYPSTMPRKTRANRIPSTPSVSPSRSQLFKNDSCREAFEKLNSKHKIWAKRSVVLDKVDLAIRTNLETRGWLSLLEIDHPLPTALIKEFFSNLSCHVYDSNTLVRSWIRGVEFIITPKVVAEALGVPVIQEPVYPYAETPPLDVIISYITWSFIQWGSDPRITSFVFLRLLIFFLR